MDYTWLLYVKEVALFDKPARNYHINLQFPSVPSYITASFSKDFSGLWQLYLTAFIHTYVSYGLRKLTAHNLLSTKWHS